MALPKETIERLFDDAVRPLLEPGERVLAGVFAAPGPSPLRVGFLGAAVQAARGQGDLWMALTDRRALFVRAAFMTQKPKGLAWADARAAVEIAEPHLDERSGWDWFVYLRPDADPLRLNVSLVWREELRTIAAELSERPAPPPEAWA